MFGAAACLCGVYAAGVRADAYGIALMLCAAFFALGVLCLCLKRSAVVCVTLAMLCLGYGLAGMRLSTRDEATNYGVRISGRVSQIVSGTRVILTQVTVEDGGEVERLRFPAAVTLMLESGEQRNVFVGQRVEGTGRLFEQETPRNPGESDRRVQAICDGYELSGYILSGWTVKGWRAFSVHELFRRWREALLAYLERVFGERAALYQAILLGVKDEMETDVLRSMRLTGVAHILTVSGMHLGLLAALLDVLLSGLGRRWRFSLKLILLWAYTMLTGCAAGTVRALIMVFLRTLASWRGRQYDALTGISAAALLMTLYNPVWPLDGAFQFSFFVTLGILLLHRRVDGFLHARFEKRLPAPLRGLLPVFSLCLSAQMAAMPMQLLFYGYVPLFSLLMNPLSSVLVLALMVTGVACMIIGAFSVRAGAACALVLGVPGWLFERLNVIVAEIEGSILRLPAPYAVTMAFVLLLMALFSDQIRLRRFFYRLRVPAALCVALLYLLRFDPAARYVQLDVGQGDAAVLRWGRHAVLIDVGPADSISMLRYLRHEGLRVDLLILSHLDEDHAGALGSLLSSEVKIKRLAMAEGAQDDADSQAVTRAIARAEEQGIPTLLLERGDQVSAQDVRFDVLSPDETLAGSNERSLVLFTEVNGVRILTTGDLPLKNEMDTWPDCDVLKVAHHGSKNATSEAMLEQTTPQIALISVGAHNSYGHPTARVLSDLEAVGARIYRTDEDGCVTIWLLGGQCRVRTAGDSWFVIRD